ncbi:MAG: hypothetical protein QOG76_8298, partial [Pseudonocardiales bacterium]|nr:hypothetical protein [Pseudonocardiales bacterium]
CLSMNLSANLRHTWDSIVGTNVANEPHDGGSVPAHGNTPGPGRRGPSQHGRPSSKRARCRQLHPRPAGRGFKGASWGLKGLKALAGEHAPPSAGRRAASPSPQADPVAAPTRSGPTRPAPVPARARPTHPPPIPARAESSTAPAPRPGPARLSRPRPTPERLARRPTPAADPSVRPAPARVTGRLHRAASAAATRWPRSAATTTHSKTPGPANAQAAARVPPVRLRRPLTGQPPKDVDLRRGCRRVSG